MHMFDGLQHEKKSPTDIDFCYEIDDKILILGEVKEQGKDVPKGQKLALTRIIDAWSNNTNKIGFYLEIQHPEQDGDIIIANCRVVNYYYGGDWKKARIPVVEFLATIGQFTNISWLTKLEDGMNG